MLSAMPNTQLIFETVVSHLTEAELRRQDTVRLTRCNSALHSAIMCPFAQTHAQQTSRCPFSSLLASPSSNLMPSTQLSDSSCPWHKAGHPSTAVSDSNCSGLDSTTCLQHVASSSSLYDDASSSSSSSDSSISGMYVHQAWQMKRPVLQHDPKLTRRQVRLPGCTVSEKYDTCVRVVLVEANSMLLARCLARPFTSANQQTTAKPPVS